MFATSLESCLWTEKYPYHSYTDALRWNDKFEYKMNYLLINNKEIGGWKYDIATNTVNFRIGGNYSIPFMVKLLQAVVSIHTTLHTISVTTNNSITIAIIIPTSTASIALLRRSFEGDKERVQSARGIMERGRKPSQRSPRTHPFLP